MSPRLRKTVLAIHLWLGLTIGLLWAIQGLTGALLVFHRDIDRMVGTVGTGGPMASADRLVAVAQRAARGATITRLAVNDGHADIVAAHYRDANGVGRAILLDSATARVVGYRELEPWTPFSGSATRWIDMTHMALDAGDTGETLIAISGAVLVTSVLSGLWVGWPRGPARKAWKTAYSVSRWKKTEHRLFGWHRVIGLTCGIAFVVMALTGIYMEIPDGTRATLGKILSVQLPYNPMMAEMHMTGPMPASDEAFPVSPQQAVDTALRRFPMARWVRLYTPAPNSPLYSVRLHQPGETRAWLGTTSVAVDARSGQVLDVYDAINAPLTNRILDATFSIHNGEIAGVPGKILILLLGLSLPALYVTGVWAWLRKRRQKAKRAAARLERRPQEVTAP